MFESISPDIKAVRQQRARYYKTLPGSLLFHAMAILAIPLGAAWDVEFPTEPPAVMVSYNLAEAPPPPPPPPPPPAAPKAQTAQVVKVSEAVPPDQIVAPSVIPDEIVPVTQPASSPPGAVVEGVEGGVEGGVVGGVVGGTPEGVAGGVIGGTAGSVAPPAVVENGRVVVARDEKLDLYPISQDYPVYPGWAQKNGLEDRLVVRYVIGRNGRVKGVTVIEPAQHDVFDEAAVDAIRTWRFRPMIRDGKKVEVVHELTVVFRLM